MYHFALQVLGRCTVKQTPLGVLRHRKISMGWEGGHGKKLSRIPVALPNPCCPQVQSPWQCSAGCWHSLCPHQPPAKCPQCVPALSLCPCWGLQISRPLTDAGAPPAWRRHGWEFQVPLLLCAWVSLPLWWELGRQHGLGRVCLHCPKAAQLSLQPREAAGVPRATSHGRANRQDLLKLLDWT